MYEGAKGKSSYISFLKLLYGSKSIKMCSSIVAFFRNDWSKLFFFQATKDEATFRDNIIYYGLFRN